MKNIKVTIDGKEYDLDIEKAKQLGIINETYVAPKMGDKFVSTLGNEYVLARTGITTMGLININLGSYWILPVTVVCYFNITEEEWKAMGGTSSQLSKKP